MNMGFTFTVVHLGVKSRASVYRDGCPAGSQLEGKEVKMERREFNKIVGAAMAGLVAGSRAVAGDDKSETDKAAKHVCRGKNDCNGQGGFKTADNACAGKNACKGKGGCAGPAH